MTGRVSEMTHVVGIQQGFTTKLGVTSEPGILPLEFGLIPGEPPVRYVDNLRFVLGLVANETSVNNATVLDDIATIHFARWVIMPGDQQLMFTSNFDGSWDQYIHDFVTVANSGRETVHNKGKVKWMDLIWGNCNGYSGTADFEAFVDFIEQNMVLTTLWYPTISDTTVRDIAWLREFRYLFTKFDEYALTLKRSSWPDGLLAAYDGLKCGIDSIDVTSV